MKRGEPLRSDPEATRAFLERGRRSSAESLRKSRKRPNGKRLGFAPASEDQRLKVRMFPHCVSCGREASEWLVIDPAHVTPRSRGGCDHELCVVGLCRAADGSGCHRAYDDGELDLLKVVAGKWPAHRDECQHALMHLNPVELVQQLANDKIVWASTTARAPGRTAPSALSARANPNQNQGRRGA